MERKCDNENEVFMFFYGAFMKLSTTWDNYLVRAEENTFNSEKKESPKLSDSAARGNYVRPCYRKF